jgi:WhiB family redox-sensing transcriptional regulator
MKLPDREPWMDEAICAQTDPDAFFPDKGGSTKEAKRTCLGCPVRQTCLDYALTNNERWGIWGGKSERDRRKMRVAA